MITENKNYWIDENSNSWNKLIYTKEQAEKLSKTLINCKNCINCFRCSDCSDCSYCYDCSDCSGCSRCSRCSYCSRCSDCSDCSDCSGCSGCSDYKSNPERITSASMGSIECQATIYWVGDNVQIICGCFNGNIEQFKAKITETHGDNEYAKQYFSWLKRVETYINSK